MPTKSALKSVLITGCSEGGIGHTLALEWKTREYRVFATARTSGAMTTLQQAGIECFEMDVTDVDTMKTVKDQVAEKTGGKLDILVNNAGQGKPPRFPHFSDLRVYDAFIGL
jgi:1-acylglycerone phosphate reductase